MYNGVPRANSENEIKNRHKNRLRITWTIFDNSNRHAKKTETRNYYKNERIPKSKQSRGKPNHELE